MNKQRANEKENRYNTRSLPLDQPNNVPCSDDENTPPLLMMTSYHVSRHDINTWIHTYHTLYLMLSKAIAKVIAYARDG